MNKTILYIAITLCVIAVLILVLFQHHGQQFDKRVTFDPKYKNPYDLSVAYNELPLLFNKGTVAENRESSNDWYDSDSAADGKTIFMLITQHFNPDSDELRSLYNFVKQGNQVFISTPTMDDAAKDYFGIGEEVVYNPVLYDYYKDSGKAFLNSPAFSPDTSYLNPGYHYSSYFTGVDSSHYHILGKDESGYPNFIKVNAGKGSFYFHSNPFLFANYFLLYRNNLSYFEKVISLMPPDKNKIIWDEYFVYKQGNNEKGDDASPFHVLFSIPAFAWAMWLAIILILLYIALNVKRLQRFIPLWEKPKNETLDFTKTIGRLYFEKGDHTNLAKKMATYLLEHIRNKYFISTKTLNEDFIKNLASKSGYEEEKVREIVGNLVYIQAGHKVTQEQLAAIYQSFSKFYKHTS